jgi:hypothetical protein
MSAAICCNTPIGILVDAQGRQRGDLDDDCDVDQSDFGIFQANTTGALAVCPSQREDDRIVERFLRHCRSSGSVA